MNKYLLVSTLFAAVSAFIIINFISTTESPIQPLSVQVESSSSNYYQENTIKFHFDKQTTQASIVAINVTLENVFSAVSNEVGFKVIYGHDVNPSKTIISNLNMIDVMLDEIVMALLKDYPYQFLKRNHGLMLCIGKSACNDKDQLISNLEAKASRNISIQNMSYSMIEDPVLITGPGSLDSSYPDMENLKSRFSGFEEYDRIKILSLLRPHTYSDDLDFILNVIKYDANANVRKEAIQKLVFIKNSKTKEALMESLVDQDEQVILAALQRLGRFKKIDKDRIKAQLLHKESAAIKFELDRLGINH